MEKKGGGAGEKQLSSDNIEKTQTTQEESTASGTDSQPHQAQEQLISSNTAESTTFSTTAGPQQGSTRSQQIGRQQTPTPQRHQVIAVSASKGPAAFFNLARKFLVTDEFCDLSALEGAIVSAVDAAHLLERSKLAVIVRIQTSYVPVEPKRKPQQDPSKQSGITAPAAATSGPASSSSIPISGTQREDQPTSSKKLHQGRKGAPLRRSRIIITVKRTDDYKQWLEDNPHLATSHGDDIDDSPT